jgi:hypothetical protein
MPSIRNPMLATPGSPDLRSTGTDPHRASAGCKANIVRAKELIAAPMPQLDPPAPQDTTDPDVATTDHRPPCPCCGGRMIIVEVFARGGAPRGPPSSAGSRI